MISTIDINTRPSIEEVNNGVSSHYFTLGQVKTTEKTELRSGKPNADDSHRWNTFLPRV